MSGPEWTDCPRALLNLPRPAVPPISNTANHSNSPTSSVQTVSKRLKFAKEELSEFAKGLVPENTNKSTKWALNNFEAPLVDLTETELQSFFSEFSGDYM